MATIVSGTDFNVNSDYLYTKPKINANGRKSIGILNNQNKKSLYMSTPLMLTWGVNEYTDDKTGDVQSYDMALQFPNDEYNNPECMSFLKNMQEFEQKIKDDAVINSKEWLNKTKLVAEAVDALWSPMLKYPKAKESGDFDYSRPPTLKVKIPYWEGEFKGVELYNENRDLVFPLNDSGIINDYIVKGSNVATIIQCGGIWVANGKFGVTWKLFQAVVKPRTTLSGKCHIMLTETEKEKIVSSVLDDDVDESDIVEKVKETQVDDSEDEDEDALDVKEEVKAEINKKVLVEDQPKKKRIVKKKAVAVIE